MNNIRVPVVHCDTFHLLDETLSSSSKDENFPPLEDTDRLIKKQFKFPIPDGPQTIPYVAVIEDFRPRPPDDTLTVVDKRNCRFCDRRPCVLDQGLYKLLTSVEYLFDVDYVRANSKSIRYDMYRQSTHFIHGPLPPGRRIKLPSCVVLTIHHFAKEADTRNYM